MKRYLLCLVAMLLLFSAYCKPYLSNANPLALRNSGPSLSGIFNIEREAISHPFSDSLFPGGFYHIDYDQGKYTTGPSPFYKYRSSVYGQINSRPLLWHLTPLPIYSQRTTELIKEQFYKNFQQVDYRRSAVYNAKKERTGFGHGAGIGAIVGAGIGLIAGFVYGDSYDSDFMNPGAGAFALMGAVAGAAIGVIIGGTIGALTKKRTKPSEVPDQY